MTLSELVDGSNESLYHPDEESDPNLRKGIPLQKNLKIIDVSSATLKMRWEPPPP